MQPPETRAAHADRRRHYRRHPAHLQLRADGVAFDLVAALQSLSPHYREIILMRDLAGYSIEELAQRLGLNREAAKSRLYRACVPTREYLVPADLT